MKFYTFVPKHTHTSLVGPRPYLHRDSSVDLPIWNQSELQGYKLTRRTSAGRTLWEAESLESRVIFLGSALGYHTCGKGGKEAGWVQGDVELQCHPNGPEVTPQGALAVTQPITVTLSQAELAKPLHPSSLATWKNGLTLGGGPVCSQVRQSLKSLQGEDSQHPA